MTNYYYYYYYYYNYNKTNKFSGKQLFINQRSTLHVASLARVHATLRLGRVLCHVSRTRGCRSMTTFVISDLNCKPLEY